MVMEAIPLTTARPLTTALHKDVAWSAEAARTNCQDVDVAAVQAGPERLQAHARLHLHLRDQRRVPRERVRREVGKPCSVLRARSRVSALPSCGASLCQTTV